MKYFVCGGSDSGKSAFAEKTIVSLWTKHKKQNPGSRLVYFATMYVDPCKGSSNPNLMERIKRHRLLRSSYPFETIEYSFADFSVLDRLNSNDCVLLEDLGNLCANELFPPPDYQEKDLELCFNKIFDFLESLSKKVSELVIVSNNAFEGAFISKNLENKSLYLWLKLLGHLNIVLAKNCDFIYEVANGIAMSI